MAKLTSLLNFSGDFPGEGGRELLVAKLLIANFNNKATVMLNISDPIESHLLKVSGETVWNPLG